MNVIDIKQYYGIWCEPTWNFVLPEFRKRRISGLLNIILKDITHK